MPLKSALLICSGVVVGVGLGHLPTQQKYTAQDFPNLVKGLKETPGCLDVKVGGIGPGGKTQTIFAWFKDKQSVQAWYTSPMHVAAMKQFFPSMPPSKSIMPKYKDTDGPFLVVASVTPGDKPILADSPLHVSQIAIEMYSPVGGGIAMGGAFGPKALGVHGPTWIQATSTEGL
ncbi:MAG TPA: antibiotic biosynthesis monooxygenase [Fimbriimonas sp.]|nr:antibiotic biosynthesis monooxygenase [Fimbriimonas sp.]